MKRIGSARTVRSALSAMCKCGGRPRARAASRPAPSLSAFEGLEGTGRPLPRPLQQQEALAMHAVGTLPPHAYAGSEARHLRAAARRATVRLAARTLAQRIGMHQRAAGEERRRLATQLQVCRQGLGRAVLSPAAQEVTPLR